MKKTKILIIKMGYSETLDAEKSKVVSLGDSLRCSVVLPILKEKYPNSLITWLASQESLPLLSHNKNIDRLLVWDEFVPFVLMREKYDIVINLEKISGICALTDMIDAWEKIGFRFDSDSGEFDTYMRSTNAKKYIEEKLSGKREIWQKIIVEMIGESWSGQEYNLGYKPKSEEIYDIGLNYKVGSKWPTKAMSDDKWKQLASELEQSGLKVSWQEGLDDLYDYIEWINSCKLLITHDSLGLHIALALKKRVVGIFGATDPEETYLYARGEYVLPKKSFDCLPCYLPNCTQDKHCMEFIDIDEVAKNVNKLLHKESI
jgi:heptosyltransferase II